MAKKCGYKNCNYPVWSKGRCRYHTPRAQIRPQSAKRKVQTEEYALKRRSFLKRHPMCAIFPNMPATEIHHVKHRENERLLDETEWLAVSRAGHEYIHHNPEEAYRKGWLKKG